MFKKETVFILGAGASCHYGYPTGEQLVAEVIKAAEQFRIYCNNRSNAGYNIDEMPKYMLGRVTGITPESYVEVWRQEIERCNDLISRLKAVSPLVIDYFLGWNPALCELGQLMIAAALLRRKATGTNVTGNWIRFIVHQLLIGCSKPEDFLRNRVHFVTFNYDLSLEHHLRSALMGVGFINKDQVDAFLSGSRITHVYGRLADTQSFSEAEYESLQANYNGVGQSVLAKRATDLVNKWHIEAEKLQVIDPHTKDSDGCRQASAIIAEKQRIYVLGFGFDDLNVKRLGFPLARLDDGPREIYFTNLKNAATVNKRAARAFGIPGLAFPDEWRVQDGNGHAVAEKSSRDTYDAIQLDFGALAE